MLLRCSKKLCLKTRALFHFKHPSPSSHFNPNQGIKGQFCTCQNWMHVRSFQKRSKVSSVHVGNQFNYWPIWKTGGQLRGSSDEGRSSLQRFWIDDFRIDSLLYCMNQKYQMRFKKITSQFSIFSKLHSWQEFTSCLLFFINGHPVSKWIKWISS